GGPEEVGPRPPVDEEDAPLRRLGGRAGARERLKGEEVEKEAAVRGKRGEEEVGVSGGVVGLVLGRVLQLDDPGADEANHAAPSPARLARAKVADAADRRVERGREDRRRIGGGGPGAGNAEGEEERKKPGAGRRRTRAAHSSICCAR